MNKKDNDEINKYKKLLQDYYQPFTEESDKLVHTNFWLKCGLVTFILTTCALLGVSLVEGYYLYVR
jgi:hypothetical protein